MWFLNWNVHNYQVVSFSKLWCLGKYSWGRWWMGKPSKSQWMEWRGILRGKVCELLTSLNTRRGEDRIKEQGLKSEAIWNESGVWKFCEHWTTFLIGGTSWVFCQFNQTALPGTGFDTQSWEQQVCMIYYFNCREDNVCGGLNEMFSAFVYLISSSWLFGGGD